MASQLERIATLETRTKWQWTAIGLLAIVGLGWLSWASTTLVSLKGDVQAIKQKIHDGGLGDIVSSLQSPQSPEQLRANLSTVIARVETAKAQGQHPDGAKVNALSRAVAQVAHTDPDLSEAWQAAAQLISFRTPLASAPPQRKCFTGRSVDHVPHPSAPLTGEDRKKADEYVYMIQDVAEDCTISLDAPDAIPAETKKTLDDDIKALAPLTVGVEFHFKRAHIIYRGGALPSYGNAYVFENCTFDWSISSPPPIPAQKIAEGLLQASNPAYVSVQGLHASGS